MQDYTALREVIAICRDAEQRFRGAANAVKTPALRTLFETWSAQRANFAQELIQAGRSMGLQVEDALGLGGTLHAGWIELRGALSGHSEHQILAEAARGEEMSVERYRTVVSMNLSNEIRAMLQNQFAQIQQTSNRIVSLRDSTARTQPPEEQVHPAR